MDHITVRGASEHNLRHVDVRIPLNKLVSVVGKSGSGKSSFVYDVLFRASQGHSVNAKISALPRTFAISQKIQPSGTMSLGETNFNRLKETLKKVKCGDLLIVDEPCSGMAKEDRVLILRMLKGAVKKGISVIAVEHSKDIISHSDYVVEFGPWSGANGGRVIFEGPVQRFKKARTPTSTYVFSNKAGLVDSERDPNDRAKRMRKKTLTIKGITKHHLKNVDITFSLGSLVCVTGRMGTGKSTLLSVVHGATFKGKSAWKFRQGFASVDGKANVRRSYFVDQSSLSPISTSTPATYLGIWDAIRDVYASLPESKKNKLKKAHFSFNTKSEAGTRDKVKKIAFHGKSIFDVLGMTMDEAVAFFAHAPLIVRKIGFLQEVGLGYLTLGQKSNTLSGGEAQRVRLAKILSKKLGDRCLYILDIPSRGLHLSDIPVLLKVFQKIIDKNNTILIAENREEVIANCDQVIRLK